MSAPIVITVRVEFTSPDDDGYSEWMERLRIACEEAVLDEMHEGLAGEVRLIEVTATG